MKMVIYTETFRADFRNAYLYIVQNFHDDMAADKLTENTISTLNKESEYISVIRRSALAAINNKAYYRINVGKHVAIYAISSNNLVVEFFCHSSQDIQRHIAKHSNMS